MLTVFMRDFRKSFGTQNIVDIDQLRINGVRHSMVADVYNIDNIGQVARLKPVLEISRKDIDVTQSFLVFKNKDQ